MLEAVVGDFVCADVRSCIVSGRPRFALRQAQGRLSADSRGGRPHMSLPIARTVAVGTCFGLLLVVPHVRRARTALLLMVSREWGKELGRSLTPCRSSTGWCQNVYEHEIQLFIWSRRLSTSMRNCAQ